MSRLRLLALTLAACMAVLMAPATAYASNEVTSTGDATIIDQATVVWGRTHQGAPVSYTTMSGADAPAADFGALAAACSLTIRNIYMNGIYFETETLQACSGAFGTDYTRAQVIRSSWRGWLGYSGWKYSGLDDDGWLVFYPRARCHSGAGTYNYKWKAQGYASAIGYSPYVYTPNYVRIACGSAE